LIIFFIVIAIMTLSSFLSIPTIFASVYTVPVTTRSMVKGGLQDDAISVPLPLHCPTCTNAIYTTPDFVDLRDTSSTDFKISEFETSK